MRRSAPGQPPTTEEVQRMLDENARLIEVVMAKQNEGKVSRSHRRDSKDQGPGEGLRDQQFLCVRH
jgi:hypothetical protein